MKTINITDESYTITLDKMTAIVGRILKNGKRQDIKEVTTLYVNPLSLPVFTDDDFESFESTDIYERCIL